MPALSGWLVSPPPHITAGLWSHVFPVKVQSEPGSRAGAGSVTPHTGLQVCASWCQSSALLLPSTCPLLSRELLQAVSPWVLRLGVQQLQAEALQPGGRGGVVVIPHVL